VVDQRQVQSTATAKAAQISRIRASANRPSRSTSVTTDTLSIVSRFTADGRGTGSSPGSRTTSLARPRRIVVQGATSARRCRGITASRDKTTTGRRPISAISHHQTSPRAGSPLTRRRRPVARTPDRPTRPAHRPGARHRRCSRHRPQRIGDGPATLEVLRRRGRRRCFRRRDRALCRGVERPPSCSSVCVSCHDYATARSGSMRHEAVPGSGRCHRFEGCPRTRRAGGGLVRRCQSVLCASVPPSGGSSGRTTSRRRRLPSSLNEVPPSA
jgi:hypothetical protein